MKRRPVKTECEELWKYSQRMLFSVTLMHIPVFLCIGTIEYQNVNNDLTDTLLPRKELLWRHNQTRARLEAQRKKTGSRCF